MLSSADFRWPSGSSSSLLSLSLFPSTEPPGPPDRHSIIRNSMGLHRRHYFVIFHGFSSKRYPQCRLAFFTTIIVVIQPSSPLSSLSLLSSTEPGGSRDRHGAVQSSVGFHRHCYRCRCYHLQSRVGHSIATLPPKTQLASSPPLSLLLLSSTERPPDRDGLVQSPVDLHRHCYRYRCYHLQSRAGHSIATVPSVAQLTFIATIIVIAVIIYRAAWATRSPRYHPKPS